MKLPNAVYIGHVAVFYVPIKKLDMVVEGEFPYRAQVRDGSFVDLTVRSLLHNYFVQNFNAYTHEVSNIQGYWMDKDLLVRDEHERYEVSFTGREKVKEFVTFLSELCSLIKEDSIYLTMGYKSWLVVPPS